MWSAHKSEVQLVTVAWNVLNMPSTEVNMDVQYENASTEAKLVFIFTVTCTSTIVKTFILKDSTQQLD